MKNYKYILAIAICLFVLSCKKTQYLLYTDIARIQFGPDIKSIYSTNARFADSLKQQSFAYLNNTKMVDTVYFDIYTMGDVSDKDRSFMIKQEQVTGAFNAVPGIHYKDFADKDVTKNYIIKAGQSHSLVPIILIRDVSLKTNFAVLKFSIAENENFKFGQEKLLWRKLIFTDKLSQPSAWDKSAVSFYGKYSEVKHRFMISNTGQKWDNDFLIKINADVQEQQYWISKVKSALIAYNNANPTAPLRDELNELVLIP